MVMGTALKATSLSCQLAISAKHNLYVVSWKYFYCRTITKQRHKSCRLKLCSQLILVSRHDFLGHVCLR